MAHIAPYVINSSGQGLLGQTLGFHAYSLRIDNLSNQWLQEASSLSWVPPYSLGVVLKLYGTSVALLLIRAPTGQPQLTPVPGEYATAMYSDEIRTEVAGVPVREFSLVQAVTDLTWGPQPALPPNGVTRLYATSDGHLHYLWPNAQDNTILDTTNYAAYVQAQINAQVPGMIDNRALGGDLYGIVSNGGVSIQYGHTIYLRDSGGTSRASLGYTSDGWTQMNNGVNGFEFANNAGTVRVWTIDNAGGVNQNGDLRAHDIYANRGDGTGVFYGASGGANYVYWTGSQWQVSGGGLLVANGYLYGTNGNNYWLLDGSNTTGYAPGDFYFRKTGGASYADLFAKYLHLSDGTNGVVYADAGSLFMRSGNAFYYFDSGTYPNGSVYIATTLNVGLQNANQYRVELPNTAGKGGQSLANAYATYACVDHAREYGLRILPIFDALRMLRAVEPVYYEHMSIDGATRLPVRDAAGRIERAFTYGMSAADLAQVAPELVGRDLEGEPIAILFDRLVAVLWAAVQQLEARLSSLEAEKEGIYELAG